MRLGVARPLPPLALVLLLLGGCAYFNTFYHARKFYSEAEAQRQKSPDGKVPAQALDLYDKCMKKCAKVLTEYEGSKWVDDALLLMGNCSLVRGEYAQALKKFEELATFYPKSDLLPEARFRTGLAYAQMGDAGRAVQALAAVLEDPKAKEFHADARFALGTSRLALGDSTGAVLALEEFLAATRERDHPSRRKAAEALAAVQIARGEPARAREAYETLRPSPRRDWVGYKTARLAVGRCLRLEGRADEALREYDALLALSEQSSDSAEVLVERALVAEAEGEDSAAAALFTEIAARFPRTEGAARALYRRGRILFLKDGDLRGARASFDSVGVHSGAIPENSDAKAWSGRLSARIALDERLAARLQRIEAAALAPQEAPAGGDSAAGGGAGEGGAVAGTDTAASGGAAASGDAARSGDAAASGDAAGEREAGAPGNPGKTAAADSAAPAVSEVEYLAALGDSGLERLFALADSAARDELAQIYIEMGQTELLKLSRVEPALAAYETVERDFPDTQALPHALFAIAWIRDNRLDDPAGADSLYWRILSEFGATPYARGAAEGLGMELAEPEPAPLDTAALRALAAARDSLERLERERRAAEAAAAAAADTGAAGGGPPPVPGLATGTGEGIPPPPDLGPAIPGTEGEASEILPGESAPAAEPRAPRVLTLAVPNYPPDLAERGIVGSVTVEVTVGATGGVLSTRVVQSDNAELDGYAVEAALRSVFSPPRGVDRTLVTFEFPPEER